MGKTWIIISREYLTHVKNKTFIVMCFLAPVLWAALFIVPPLLAGQPGASREIVVVDASGIPDSLGYAYVFKDTANLKFNYNHVYEELDKVEALYKDSSGVSVLYIPENFMGGGDTAQLHSQGLAVILKSRKEPGFNTLNLLQTILTKEVQKDIMQVNKIDPGVMEHALRKVAVLNEIKGTVGNSTVKAITGLAFGMIIYMYILMFGVRIMRSVVEEKTTRIVEVIVSSVKPFQLMMGKIIGVTLVGITQFSIWILLSLLIITPVVGAIQDKQTDLTQLTGNANTGMPVNPGAGKLMNFEITDSTVQTMDTIMSIPWGNLIPAFLFYFIFGYLMYAALFAAIGSAADTDSDTSQFSLPVTIPLIIAIASSGAVLNDPDGTIAKWLSMIPLTSPVVMLMRIPYGGVYVLELFLSMFILVVSFIFFTWIAGRIYRTGILMYGKKISWKELGKWMFYRG